MYLVDGTGVILASNASSGTGVTTLQHFAPELAASAQREPHGRFQSGDTERVYANVAVPHTTWSLVLAAPSESVFTATRGTAHWLPWLILVLLSLLLLAASMLTIRLIESRYQLSLLNGQLVEIARTDVLTGLSNRRSLVEQLETVLANSSRHRFPVCVLMIDIDHFKQINDAFGHSAGDRAIRHVASLLTMHRREGDLIARWGGEEFLAVLPYSNLRDGISAAKRLCQLVGAEPVALDPDRDPVTLRVSIGVALAGDDSIDAVIDRADLGLYEAKAAGRNTVRTVDPLDATTASPQAESSAR